MLNKLKLGPKLIGGFMIVSVITMVIGVMGISNMGKINQLIKTMYNNHLLGIGHAKEANVNMVLMGREVRNMILASTTNDRQNYEKRLPLPAFLWVPPIYCIQANLYRKQGFTGG